MELACMVLFGALGFAVLVFIAGIIACESERRQRKKKTRREKNDRG